MQAEVQRLAGYLGYDYDRGALQRLLAIVAEGKMLGAELTATELKYKQLAARAATLPSKVGAIYVELGLPLPADLQEVLAEQKKSGADGAALEARELMN
jgi:hypothetical protein